MTVTDAEHVDAHITAICLLPEARGGRGGLTGAVRGFVKGMWGVCGWVEELLKRNMTTNDNLYCRSHTCKLQTLYTA